MLAALCLMSKDKENKLELKIDNVLFLSSQTILRPNQADYNVVFAVKVIVLLRFLIWDMFLTLVDFYLSRRCHGRSQDAIKCWACLLLKRLPKKNPTPATWAVRPKFWMISFVSIKTWVIKVGSCFSKFWNKFFWNKSIYNFEMLKIN